MRDRRDAMHAHAMRRLEIDEQHPDLVAGVDVAHRQEHAIAVVARENDGPGIHHSDETGRATFVRTGRIATMVDRGEKEHIASFDKRFLLIRDFRSNDHLIHAIGEPRGIELLLQGPMLLVVNLAHVPLPERLKSWLIHPSTWRAVARRLGMTSTFAKPIDEALPYPPLAGADEGAHELAVDQRRDFFEIEVRVG